MEDQRRAALESSAFFQRGAEDQRIVSTQRRGSAQLFDSKSALKVNVNKQDIEPIFQSRVRVQRIDDENQRYKTALRCVLKSDVVSLRSY